MGPSAWDSDGFGPISLRADLAAGAGASLRRCATAPDSCIARRRRVSCPPDDSNRTSVRAGERPRGRLSRYNTGSECRFLLTVAASDRRVASEGGARRGGYGGLRRSAEGLVPPKRPCIVERFGFRDRWEDPACGSGVVGAGTRVAVSGDARERARGRVPFARDRGSAAAGETAAGRGECRDALCAFGGPAASGASTSCVSSAGMRCSSAGERNGVGQLPGGALGRAALLSDQSLRDMR